MSGELVIFVLHLGVAALLFITGQPLRRQAVRPNRWCGFRTPSTLSDERIWYPVNKLTGRWMVAIGAMMAPIVMGTYLLELPAGLAAGINSIPLVGLFAMTLHGFWRIHQLKQTLS